MRLATTIFVGIFAVAALGITLVRSNTTIGVINALGGQLASLGASLESGTYQGPL